jgi:hypothetical protein
VKLYHGNIVFSKSRDELAEYRNSYIEVADDGTVEGIYPEKYAGVLTEDFGDDLIIPAFTALSPAQLLERFCYCGETANIRERFLSGKRISASLI